MDCRIRPTTIVQARRLPSTSMVTMELQLRQVSKVLELPLGKAQRLGKQSQS